MKNKQYTFFCDPVSNKPVEVLSEATNSDGSLKVVFKARLQTAAERNQNRRIYSREVCESIVNQLSPKAKDRSLLMEVDHPMVLSDNPAHTKRRATAIHIKDCGCLIRRIYMEGNDVIGEIETLSNRNGQDIANLVARDKVNIGFSLRALGGVKTDPDGTVIVQLPIRAITYDIVSNPSHASARIVEYLPESCSEMNSFANGEIMYESADSSDVQFLVEQDSININNQINLEESNFIKSIINDQFNNAIKHIRFKF